VIEPTGDSLIRTSLAAYRFSNVSRRSGRAHGLPIVARASEELPPHADGEVAGPELVDQIEHGR